MTYIIINTCDYNNTEDYSVTESTESELAGFGLDENEINTCLHMAVGDIAPSDNFLGVYFMRVI